VIWTCISRADGDDVRRALEKHGQAGGIGQKNLSALQRVLRYLCLLLFYGFGCGYFDSTVVRSP
jgi:hypothetical protein